MVTLVLMQMGMMTVAMALGRENADGERLCDAMELIATNTSFKRQNNKLATYASGSTMSTVDYLLLRRSDRQIVRNMKVIAGERCVSQYRLLVGDVIINGAPSKKRKMHTSRLKVWKCG